MRDQIEGKSLNYPATSSKRSFLEQPLLSRVRRNHGLEHATLHILARRHPRVGLGGHSDSGGFWVIGNVPIEEVHQAVEEALGRLRKGETDLAIHPHCGTNFVTAGVLAGTAAGLAMLGAGQRTRDKFERLPLAMTLATLALILAQPLGLWLQERITTSGEMGDLHVIEIVTNRRGGLTAYRVVTRG